MELPTFPLALAMAIMDLMVEAIMERYWGRFHCSELMHSWTSAMRSIRMKW